VSYKKNISTETGTGSQLRNINGDPV